jgi:hypothetical protein
MLRSLLLTLATAGLLCAGTHAGAAPAVGVVTIVEGKARLLRGANVYNVQEGLALAPQDIIETDERAHVQVEYADGSAIGVGPKSSAWLGNGPVDATHAGEAFLLSGWLKVSGPGSAGLVRTSSPAIVLIPKGGAYVLHVQLGQAEFFCETAALLPATPGKQGGTLAPLKSGDFAEVKADHSLVAAKRPSPAFLGALPRMFADTLPARYAKFAAAKVEPVLVRPTVFDEADRWIRGDPAERKSLLARFAGRLKDKDFRAQVDDNASAYPEWDRILHPEKYAPKPAKP